MRLLARLFVKAGLCWPKAKTEALRVRQQIPFAVVRGARERLENGVRRVALQDAHEQPMRGRALVALVGYIPRLQLRAGDVGMDQTTRSALWLEPMNLLQIDQPGYCRTPTIPFALYDNQGPFVNFPRLSRLRKHH
jgi:hypothetical protein